jgi:hypothetical protein
MKWNEMKMATLTDDHMAWLRSRSFTWKRSHSFHHNWFIYILIFDKKVVAWRNINKSLLLSTMADWVVAAAAGKREISLKKVCLEKVQLATPLREKSFIFLSPNRDSGFFIKLEQTQRWRDFRNVWTDATFEQGWHI